LNPSKKILKRNWKCLIPKGCSCVNNTCVEADTSSSTPFFPVQNNPSEFRMTALLEGELVLEDGCLRVRVDDGYDNYLLVWPYGFSVSTEDGIIQIIDDTGQPIARGR